MDSTDRPVTFKHRHTGSCRTAVSIALLGLSLLVTAPATLAADIGNDLAQSITNGEFNINLRYRYEYVDQSDNGKRDANASTLLTRMIFRTDKWNDLDITLNMDDLRPIVGRNFNDTRNGKTEYQTVADPKGTSLNIAALTYSGIENTTIVGGRQRIKRANDRFIGNVGWRQNEQTYDALSAKFKNDRFDLFYSYVDRVNRIFGPEDGSPPDTFSSGSHLIDAAYTLNNALSVMAYGYLLDLDDRTGSANAYDASNQTIGIRASGAPSINDDWAITYWAEYANQQDYEDSSFDYDANYGRAELGLKWKRFSLKAGYELLESDQSATKNGVATAKAFFTPLATLHAHNGWADRFLSTPADGLQDTFIAASAKISNGTVKLVLHDFQSDAGSTDYGTEVDFSASYPFGKYYAVLAKLAHYSGDSNAPGALNQDTTKAWLQLTANF
jgi:hypothetical protein